MLMPSPGKPTTTVAPAAAMPAYLAASRSKYARRWNSASTKLVCDDAVPSRKSEASAEMNESFIASQMAPTLRFESQCEGEDARDAPLIGGTPTRDQRIRNAVERQGGATLPAWLKITLGD